MFNKIKNMLSGASARKDKKLEKEFLPEALEIVEKPSSPLGYLFIWLITSIILVCLIWSIFGRVDEIAFARGKINTVDGLQIIQPVNGGKITEICVKEGEHVKAGQKLIVLDSTAEKIQIDSAEEKLNISKYEISLLKDMLDFKDISSYSSENLIEAEKNVLQYYKTIYKEYNNQKEQNLYEISSYKKEYDIQSKSKMILESELESLKSKKFNLEQIDPNNAPETLTLKELSDLIDSAKKEEQDYNDLFQKGIISENEWIQKSNQLKQLENQYEIQKSKALIENIELTDDSEEINKKIGQAYINIDAQKVKLEQIQEQISQAEKDSSTLQIQYIKSISSLLVEKEKFVSESKYNFDILKYNYDIQTLVSPVDGVVQNLTVNTLGGVATSAQPIASVVPDSAQLIMEAELVNKDIGFVKTGQEVIIKLDTYPFQKYGKIKGKVIYISPDALQDEKKGLIYKVKISLDASEILSENDSVSILTGMEGTAEIKVDDRRIIEFFLEPLIEHFDNSLKVR